MANDGELKFGTKIDTKGFEEGVDDLKKKGRQATDDFDRGLDGNEKSLVSLKNVAKVAGTYIAGSLFKDALTQGVEFNAQIEQYTTSFEVMTGSAEKATEVVERLKKIGAETPFELPQLAEVTQLLMNYGFTADEAIDRMNMLGDISQGNADKMNRIAMAYGQMSSAGKVSLEDIKQMIEAGFNPLQEISQTTGESMESLYDRISKGTISVDEITASMQRSTSEGGKYFQSMEKQSETLDGKISTLKDTWNNFLGDAVKPLSDFLKDTLIPALTEVLENFEKYEPVLTLVGIAVGTVTALLIAYNIQQSLATANLTLWGAVCGFATAVTTALGTAFAFLTSPIGLVILAIGAVIAIGYLLIENWDSVVEFAYRTWEQICTAFSNVGTWFDQNVLQPIKTVFTTVWNTIYDTVKGIWDNILKLFSSGGKIFSGVVDGIANVFKTIVNTLISGINKVIAVPFKTINGLLNTIRNASFLGISPFKGLWEQNPLPVPKIPKLEKGGILKKGQVGFLEGNGAEAVVPLDRNKYWIKAVAKEFDRNVPQTVTNNKEQVVNFYTPVSSPSEVSRKMRIDARLGLIG